MGIIFEILLLWVFWSFIFIGLGNTVYFFVYSFVSRDDGIIKHVQESIGVDRFFDCFWIGWASSLFFLQIWHFFSPVNIGAFLACFLISLIGWESYRRFFKLNRVNSWAWVGVFLAISIIVAVWLAMRLWSAITIYDHPLYYLQQIFWAKSYSIIPGLANLYNRLGFYDGFVFIDTWL